MTYDASNTRASTAGTAPAQRDVSDAHPLTAWRAVRQAARFVFDVADEASRLRTSLHRRYSVVEE